jgi:hypothetical protein
MSCSVSLGARLQLDPAGLNPRLSPGVGLSLTLNDVAAPVTVESSLSEARAPAPLAPPSSAPPRPPPAQPCPCSPAAQVAAAAPVTLESGATCTLSRAGGLGSTPLPHVPQCAVSGVQALLARVGLPPVRLGALPLGAAGELPVSLHVPSVGTWARA